MRFSTVLAMTKREWYTYLRDHYQGGIVNLFFPSTHIDVDLKPNDIMAFCFKPPIGHVGGYGYLEEYTTMTVAKAWERFGTMNGYADEASFKEQFTVHARKAACTVDELMIGCFALRECRFYKDRNFIRPDASFFTEQKRIVWYKKLDVKIWYFLSFFYEILFIERTGEEQMAIFEKLEDEGHVNYIHIEV